jgi:hypothetical protein
MFSKVIKSKRILDLFPGPATKFVMKRRISRGFRDMRIAASTEVVTAITLEILRTSCIFIFAILSLEHHFAI